MCKKVIVACICVMFLATTVIAFAEDVYVTKRGKKYHTAECRFVKDKETQKISKEAAIEKGLKPCGRCFKEDVASNVADGQQKSSAVKSKKTDKLSKAEKQKSSAIQ